mmetsp:Transcript_159897/g.283331  ORF Transcript_159897/g.283331 Transcript_159897/m.283331 type:complete len:372 (-) Transcript_159897:335-1450(-)
MACALVAAQKFIPLQQRLIAKSAFLRSWRALERSTHASSGTRRANARLLPCTQMSTSSCFPASAMISSEANHIMRASYALGETQQLLGMTQAEMIEIGDRGFGGHQSNYFSEGLQVGVLFSGLRSDRDLILDTIQKCAQYNHHALIFDIWHSLAPEWQSDRDVVQSVLENADWRDVHFNQQDTLRSMMRQWSSDREIAIAAVQLSGPVLQLAHADLRTDREFLLSLFERNPRAVQFMPQECWADFDFLTNVLKRQPSTLSLLVADPFIIPDLTLLFDEAWADYHHDPKLMVDDSIPEKFISFVTRVMVSKSTIAHEVFKHDRQGELRSAVATRASQKLKDAIAEAATWNLDLCESHDDFLNEEWLARCSPR